MGLVSIANEMADKYADVFMTMYKHSEESGHADDNMVVFSKIMANATAGANYWMPEDCDKEAIFEDFRAIELD